jgi:hypothetical protein
VDLRTVRFAIIALVAVGIALGLGMRIGRNAAGKESKQVQAPQAKVPDDDSRQAAVQEAVRQADEALTPEDHSLRDFLASFFAARSWKDLLPLVRNPSLAGPRMLEYYEEHPLKGYEDLVVSTKATKVGKLIVLTLTGKGLPNNRLILEQYAGSYKIDWESFVIWQEAPWSEIGGFLHQDGAEVRCLAKPVPNNHPAFRRDAWIAYELFNPATKETLFAYLERREGLEKDSPRDILTRGAVGPCTLRIRPAADADGNKMLTVDEVLAIGWVYPEPAKEGG